MSYFKPFPILKSNIITLRKIKVSDKHAYFAIRSNPEVNKYIDRPAAKYLKDVGKHISILNNIINKDEGIIWTIEIEKENNFIGTIGLRNFNKTRTKAEIGFELHPSFQKKGFMYQALKLVISYCFGKLNLKTIEAIIHPDNYASQNLVIKYGFKVKPSPNISEKLKCYILKNA